eukprot:5456713-Lingulodinium_polyedra.AAC.1
MSGPLLGARCCVAVAVRCCALFSQPSICPAGSEVARRAARTARRGGRVPLDRMPRPRFLCMR